MAASFLWYDSELSKETCDLICKDLEKYENDMKISLVANGTQNIKKRNSKNAWVPTSHWVTGLLWHYICKANRENFDYNITNFDSETIQYTVYNEGEYYGWHNDADIENEYKRIATSNIGPPESIAQDFLTTSTELVRKLSCVIQLSSHEDYEGGNVQLLTESSSSTHFLPRKRGTVAIFDSRMKHRVLPITKGVRKSLVAWVVGPRWK